MAKVLVKLPLMAIEGALFFGFFFLYYIGRGFRADQPGPATENAERVIDFERSLGVFWELDWHQWANSHEAVIEAANVTYGMLHLPTIYVLGAIFFLVNMRKYRVLRNAMLLSALLAIPVYHAFPLTPPRLLELNGIDMGFVDTLGSARGSKAEFLTNNYAAMPSYHFGWIMLMVVYGTWWFTRSRVLRAAAVVFAAWMWCSIIFTANHYFIDLVVGAVIVTGTFWVALRWEAFLEKRPSAARWWSARWTTPQGERFREPF